MSPPRPRSTQASPRASARSAAVPGDGAGLLVLALGAVPDVLVAGVADGLSAMYDLRTSIAPRGDRPALGFNPARGQYHATAILRHIGSPPSSPAPPAVLALTHVDLFLPDVAFVFGAAEPAARAAVVSAARLVRRDVAPDGGRLLRRVLTVAVHEAGHLLGLAHCDDVGCAMRQSRDAGEVDAKRPDLCATCRAAYASP